MTQGQGYKIALGRIEDARASGAEFLSLSGLALESIPSEIAQLTQLTNLDLSNNQLPMLPPEIGKLTQLTNLDLNNNLLTSLPPEIGKLTRLTNLVLFSNQLPMLPPEIGKLTQLTNLVLFSNQLPMLPPEITQLTQLTNLDLSNNQLPMLPPEITQLTQLTNLDLSNNQLPMLPPEIGKLTQLTELRLYSNKLTTLPSEIGKLTQLELLFLFDNQLISMPPEIAKLSNLRKLALYDNFLKVLPPELAQLNLRLLWARDSTPPGTITIEDNPMESPPIETIKQGVKAVRAYFDEIEKNETVQLFEAKVLVVGQGGVGKTFLVNRLIYNNPEKKVGSTLGIDIDKWQLKIQQTDNFQANVWDFGGQVIYHATHQFFLTKRSLYLFVWDGRTDADLVNFDYWLNTVKVLTGDSPILVIQGKVDERKKSINQDYWKTLFPNIVAFYDVSAVKNWGIKELREAICEGLGKLPHIGDKLPKRWMDIRKKIEGIRRNYIPYSEYEGICNKHEMTDEQTDRLSTYYHDLGVFLNFKDNPVLKNTIFIKPHWATNAVYKVIDDKDVQGRYGRFCFADLPKIWNDSDEFPPKIHTELVELMKSFELCFELPMGNEYIIPELLRADEPAEVQWKRGGEVLQFKYVYEFMPAGIITRFIVKAHNLIESDYYWKDGVVLEWDNTRARITKSKDRLIDVEVSGANRKSLLAIIRSYMDEIHSPFTNLIVKELFPCVCSECLTNESPFFHEYPDLLKAQLRDRLEVDCRESWEDVKIESILGNAVRVINPLQTIMSRIDELEATLKRGQDKIIEELKNNLQDLYGYISDAFDSLESEGMPRQEVMIMIEEVRKNQRAQLNIIYKDINDFHEKLNHLQPVIDEMTKKKMASFDTTDQKVFKWLRKVLAVNLLWDAALEPADFSILTNWIKKD